MIPDGVIEEIRTRIDAVEVIGRRLELRRAGTSFSAACPFHADRTPSFRVYPDSRRFKCFGCGARGDVFEFVRRFDGKDFRTVVRELAGEAGVAVTEDGSGAAVKPDAGSDVVGRACEAAQAHWSEQLWGAAGAEARAYLKARGIVEKTARQFRLGFAPAEWHDLEQALRARGFTAADLVHAGLLRETANKANAYHDRFRGRVMFPFAGLDRRVLGFGGRALAPSGDEPKYLNSPETPLFRKGHLLFALADARAAIQTARRAVLVEGYFDAITLHQADFRETIAASGTALMESQIATLQRSGCEELIVAFDGDAAGLEAPARIAPALLAAGLSARVAQLPRQGADPDTFLRAHGANVFSNVLDTAAPLTEWLLERAIAARSARTASRALSVEQKLLIVRDLRPFVAAMRPGLPRALFEQRIARRLELYIVALRAELARSERPGATNGRRAGGA